jgi:hypothetical protein
MLYYFFFLHAIVIIMTLCDYCNVYYTQNILGMMSVHNPRWVWPKFFVMHVFLEMLEIIFVALLPCSSSRPPFL